ncbi:hypothetical protein MMC25_007866 [Agyrium rufum]|nr:hypothetical protein [Agyrium rufum]
MASPTAITSALSAVATSLLPILPILANKDKSPPEPETGECQLLGPFAIFIQSSLGLLALLVLVFKRWRERPQRPLKIWAFDASKQVVGSALLHLANLLMSMLSSGQLDVSVAAQGVATENPCSFYFLNLAIDTTVGIPILVVLLRLLTHGFVLTPLGNPPESIQSGNYGDPPKATWWAKQCLIYFIGLLGMKAFVLLFFKMCPWIVKVGDWALRWTDGSETLQVIFVMLVFPVIMNALQYYIIDGFIKNQKPSDHEPIPSDDGNSSHHGRDDDDLDDSFDGADGSTKAKESEAFIGTKDLLKERTQRSESDAKKLDEYDPDVDGASSSSAERPDSGSSSVAGVDQSPGQKEGTKKRSPIR